MYNYLSALGPESRIGPLGYCQCPATAVHFARKKSVTLGIGSVVLKLRSYGSKGAQNIEKVYGFDI